MAQQPDMLLVTNGERGIMFTMTADQAAEVPSDAGSPGSAPRAARGRSWKTLAQARRLALENSDKLADALAGYHLRTSASWPWFARPRRIHARQRCRLDALDRRIADAHHFDLTQEIRGVVAALA